MKRIFIDGSAGTTGLRIRERLGAREDIELLTLPEELRKDPNARREMLNAADAVFLCGTPYKRRVVLRLSRAFP